MKQDRPDVGLGEVKSFIQSYIAEKGFPPSVREIADKMECSTSTVHKRLGHLKENGEITWQVRTPRTISVLH